MTNKPCGGKWWWVNTRRGATIGLRMRFLSYRKSVWKGIRKGRDFFKHFISFEVGNGVGVRFWKDKQCEDTKLGVFPNLYNIVVDNDVMVNSNFVVKECKVTRNPIFRRAVQDWELGEIGKLFELLYA